ncbi:MAG TPA: hypothetical protein VFK87_00515, partial [Steroidobacteraceae bacterium]|nr:hypothetical protein [Steroidobacteraceae bacterium]
MSFSDETLMAYADDELDGATRAAVEAAIASDPGLAQRIARQRALRERLRHAFDPVLAEPVPERLLAGARAAPAVLPAGRVVRLERRAMPRWSWPQWGAIAASLGVGVVLGALLLSAPAGAPLLVSHDGRLEAGGLLARALQEQLASAQPAAAPVEIGVSFRAHGGEYCRSFVVPGRSPLAGLACHDPAAWRVVALAQSEAAPVAGGGAYRAAASALPPDVARTLDALI